MSFAPARARLADLAPETRQRLAAALLAALANGELPRFVRPSDPGRPDYWATRLYDMKSHGDPVASKIGLERLPAWTPDTDIPPEFMAVAAGAAPLVNAHPDVARPADLLMPLVERASIGEPAEGWVLGARVHAYDMAMSQAIGGALTDDAQAWAAPLYWCFAAWAGDMYGDLALAKHRFPDLAAAFIRISCVAVRDSKVNLFLNANSSLYTIVQKAPGGEWTPWTHITEGQGGGVPNAVITRDKDFKLHAFGWERGGKVCWTHQASEGNTTWAPRDWLPGSQSLFPVIGIGACLNSDQNMDFFAIAESDGKIYNKAGHGGIFLDDWGYVGSGGLTNGSMTVNYMPQDRTVIVLYVADAVWALTQQQDGVCRDPYRISGTLRGIQRIWCARNSGEKLTVLAIDGQGTLWCCFSNEDDGHWETEYEVAHYVGQACLVRGQDQRLALFTCDARSGVVSQRWQLTKGSRDWTPPRVIGGPGITQLAGCLNGDGRIELFGIRPEQGGDTLWRATQIQPGLGYMGTLAQFS